MSPKAFKIESVRTKSKTAQTGVTKPILEREIVPYYSSRRKEDFYTELAVLLEAQMPLKESLELLMRSKKKKKQQDFYSSILKPLDEGNAFHESMRSINNCTAYEWTAIKIGEETGQLDQVVKALSSFFERKNTFRKTLVNALAYPTLLLISSFAVLLFMLTTIIPLFKDIFEQQQVALPFITQQVIYVSNLLQSKGLLLLFVGIMAFIAILILRKQQRIKDAVNFTLIKIPLLSTLIKSNYYFEFSQTMALLSEANVPLVKSLKLLEEMILFAPLQQALQHIRTQLLKGSGISKAVEETAFFDAQMFTFLKVAEETHQLGAIFTKLSQQYQEQLSRRSKLFSSLLEPIIIIVVGALIALILIAMYLPVFRLSSVLG